MHVICKTEAMQQPYLYILKVRVGAWTLNTLLPMHAVGWGSTWTTGSPPDSLHSGPSVEWASFLCFFLCFLSQHHIKVGDMYPCGRAKWESTGSACPRGFHVIIVLIQPGFPSYCHSASPLVMLSSTLDAETTACLRVPISLYNHARTSFITNPLFYSVHRATVLWSNHHWYTTSLCFILLILLGVSWAY